MFNVCSKFDNLKNMKLTGFVGERHMHKCVGCNVWMGVEAESFCVRSTTLFIPFYNQDGTKGYYNDLLRMNMPIEVAYLPRFQAVDMDKMEVALFSLSHISVQISGKDMPDDHQFCIGRYRGCLMVYDNCITSGIPCQEALTTPLCEVVKKHLAKLNQRGLKFTEAWVVTVVYGRRLDLPATKPKRHLPSLSEAVEKLSSSLAPAPEDQNDSDPVIVEDIPSQLGSPPGPKPEGPGQDQQPSPTPGPSSSAQ